MSEIAFVLTNEDGDVYYAEGHLSDDDMRASCIAAEQEWSGEDYPDPPGLEEAIQAASISRHWIIDCEWNDEGTHEVAEGTKGAQAITRLLR